MDITIERASSDDDDAEAVCRLLAENRLPLDGVRDHLQTAVVARREGKSSVAALEGYADGVLMRSVAVAPTLQNTGLGRRLTEAALDLAREIRAPNAYLLTTTATEYFPHFGFERIARTDVPASVQTSIEVRAACPSSATVMRKAL